MLRYAYFVPIRDFLVIHTVPGTEMFGRSSTRDDYVNEEANTILICRMTHFHVTLQSWAQCCLNLDFCSIGHKSNMRFVSIGVCFIIHFAE